MSNSISQTVQNFYNQTPFPDYELDRFNTKENLKLAASSFAKILDRSIPTDASIIDIGTGTGQLSAFLSLRRKRVWGIDFSEASLNKARALKNKLNLDSWHLKKVNLLDPEQIAGIGQKFDYVLCLGVLHHTENPYSGFQNILELLNPEGYLALGLYNKVGRVPLKIRRLLAKSVFKKNQTVKNWFIKMQIGETADKEKIRGWWSDQYLHPYESSHTLGEVLRWFQKNGISYYQSIPPVTPFDQSALEITGAWNNTGETYPYLPIRLYQQLTWLWKTHKEGGYWITFGRRRK